MVEERYERILSTIGHITFLYTLFPSFIPIPYIHALGKLWEDGQHIVEFGLALFFSKPSPNLFVIFDYNHQITKESQDIVRLLLTFRICYYLPDLPL